MLAQQTKKTVVVLILSLGLVYVLAASAAAPPGELGSANESLTVQTGEWVALEHADSAHTSSNLTLDDTNGTAYDEGTDYEYNASDLSVKALASGSMSDGETVTASYDYRARSDTHRKQTDALARYSSLISLGAWGAAVFLVIGAFRALSTSGGKGL